MGFSLKPPARFCGSSPSAAQKDQSPPPKVKAPRPIQVVTSKPLTKLDIPAPPRAGAEFDDVDARKATRTTESEANVRPVWFLPGVDDHDGAGLKASSAPKEFKPAMPGGGDTERWSDLAKEVDDRVTATHKADVASRTEFAAHEGRRSARAAEGRRFEEAFFDDLHEKASTIQRGYRRHMGAKHQPQAQRVAREMASKKNDPPHWYKRAVEQGATPLANVGKTPAALAKEKAVAAATLAAKVRANYAPGARVNVVRKAAPPAPPASEAAAAADEAAFQASAARPAKRGEAPAATKARRDARDASMVKAYADQEKLRDRIVNEDYLSPAQRNKLDAQITKIDEWIREREDEMSGSADEDEGDVEGGPGDVGTEAMAIKSLSSIGGFSDFDAQRLHKAGFISFKNAVGATMFRRKNTQGKYALSNKGAAFHYLAHEIPTHIVIDGSKAPHPPSHLRGKH